MNKPQYTLDELGQELMALVNSGVDIIAIAKWAFQMYTDPKFKIHEAKVHGELGSLMAMDAGPEFEYTIDQVKEMALRYMNEGQSEIGHRLFIGNEIFLKLNCSQIELFNNISQIEYRENCYEFHNDYSCVAIYISEGKLLLELKHLIDNSIVSYIFNKAEIVKFRYRQCTNGDMQNIDNIYRGRWKQGDNLYEFSPDGKGYFFSGFW